MPRRATIQSDKRRAQIEMFRRIRVSPRIRLAARLYASGAMNQRQAARSAGIDPSYFAQLKSTGNTQVMDIIERVDKEMEKNLTDLSEVKKMLAHRALRNMGYLMENSVKDEVRLKAAQDLMDRHTETAKTQQLEVTGMMVKGDAKALAEALVEAARLRGAGGPVGDCVKVVDEPAALPSETKNA